MVLYRGAGPAARLRSGGPSCYAGQWLRLMGVTGFNVMGVILSTAGSNLRTQIRFKFSSNSITVVSLVIGAEALPASLSFNASGDSSGNVVTLLMMCLLCVTMGAKKGPAYFYASPKGP